MAEIFTFLLQLTFHVDKAKKKSWVSTKSLGDVPPLLKWFGDGDVLVAVVEKDACPQVADDAGAEDEDLRVWVRRAKLVQVVPAVQDAGEGLAQSSFYANGTERRESRPATLPTNIARVNLVMGCSKVCFSLFPALPWRTNAM